MFIAYYGCFADAGAAPTAGHYTAIVAHYTADEASTWSDEEVPHANTAAQAAFEAVGDTSVGLAGSPQPAQTKKTKTLKSGIGSDNWQDGHMLASLKAADVSLFTCRFIIFHMWTLHPKCFVLISPMMLYSLC